MLRWFTLIGCLLAPGCAVLPTIVHQPTLHNPFPQISKVAVAPFFNASSESTLDGRKVVLLELLPKTDEVKKQLSKIHLWLDESTWLPAQQQFFETGSGDYFTIRYKNVSRNVRINDSEFKPHWPHGTTKVQPQG